MEQIGAVHTWARDNVPAVAAQLSPLVGLDAPTLGLALRRASYGVQPIDAATFAYQQQIVATFSDLELIP